MKQIIIHRNIPACAGKTSTASILTQGLPEHPRVRGENCEGRVSLSVYIGTSPRAQGKQKTVLAWCYFRRNIPACAGKTEEA